MSARRHTVYRSLDQQSDVRYSKRDVIQGAPDTDYLTAANGYVTSSPSSLTFSPASPPTVFFRAKRRCWRGVDDTRNIAANGLVTTQRLARALVGSLLTVFRPCEQAVKLIENLGVSVSLADRGRISSMVYCVPPVWSAGFLVLSTFSCTKPNCAHFPANTD